MKIKVNKIILLTLTLSIIGIVMIYSSSYVWATFKYDNPYKYVINQSMFLVIGISLMSVLSKIDISIFKKYSSVILLISFLLLGIVLIPGLGIIRNGSRSWFSILGFGFQPSEIVKISLIIFTSKYLSRNDSLKKNTFKFIFPILLVLLVNCY